ncbi:hypothetical protein ACIF80_11235 [Streptomyces sp. NPDC085927]|uniref:hypothetical protein n=1 Tax=Streptomyces sp. NPDC085927 TaxID=3365738 RepID=UPI0037D4CDC0
MRRQVRKQALHRGRDLGRLPLGKTGHTESDLHGGRMVSDAAIGGQGLEGVFELDDHRLAAVVGEGLSADSEMVGDGAQIVRQEDVDATWRKAARGFSFDSVGWLRPSSNLSRQVEDIPEALAAARSE